MATLAQESFDILTLLPTYIENTKDAIATLSKDSKVLSIKIFGDTGVRLTKLKTVVDTIII